MISLRYWVSVFAVLANISVAALPSNKVDIDHLNLRIEKLIERDDMFGLALAVVEDGELVFAKGYGELFEDGPEVDVRTQFRWASLSKGVAGSLAGLMASEAKLALDSPLSDFDTSLRLPHENEKIATVSDLLSHRLGLVPNAYDGRLEDGRMPERIRASFVNLSSLCPPGSCHTYQNVAFDTITEILRDVADTSYVALAREKLFGPLNMTDTSIGLESLTSVNNYARPHRRSRRSAPYKMIEINDTYYRVPAAGGINSSILDLASYMRAQMGRTPEVLPQAVLDLIHTPLVPTPNERRRLPRKLRATSDPHYGLGWRIYTYAGHKVVGHRGAVNGYRALIFFDPERDTGVVAMWNSSTSRPVGLQYEVMDMVYGREPYDWMRLDVVPKERPAS